MVDRVRFREIDDDEGQRLLRIIRRGSGSVVTWRRTQIVLLSARGMPVAKVAEVTFTSADRVRDVIHNFNADGPVWFVAGIPQLPDPRRVFIPGDEIVVVFSGEKMRDIGFDDPAFLGTPH